MLDNYYAKLPFSVLGDPELSNNDLLVYGFLSLRIFDGNIACVGQRLIASTTGLDRTTIRLSLANLGRRGHISTSVVHLKKRNVYQLNWPGFAHFADKQLGSPLDYPMVHPEVGSPSPTLWSTHGNNNKAKTALRRIK